MGYIVVGVDGTDGSVAALRWAAREAVRLDADLVAVHAWPSGRGSAAVAERDLRGARSAVRANMLSWVRSALDPRTTPVRRDPGRHCDSAQLRAVVRAVS